MPHRCGFFSCQCFLIGNTCNTSITIRKGFGKSRFIVLFFFPNVLLQKISYTFFVRNNIQNHVMNTCVPTHLGSTYVLHSSVINPPYVRSVCCRPQYSSAPHILVCISFPRVQYLFTGLLLRSLLYTMKYTNIKCASSEF